jgi:hypothetical protein
MAIAVKLVFADNRNPTDIAVTAFILTIAVMDL